jgi:hypothetical protein
LNHERIAAGGYRHLVKGFRGDGMASSDDSVEEILVDRGQGYVSERERGCPAKECQHIVVEQVADR